MVGISTGFRTEHLPNTRQERHRFSCPTAQLSVWKLVSWLLLDWNLCDNAEELEATLALNMAVCSPWLSLQAPNLLSPVSHKHNGDQVRFRDNALICYGFHVFGWSCYVISATETHLCPLVRSLRADTHKGEIATMSLYLIKHHTMKMYEGVDV
jgi:NADPH-dependent 7-cyano-7-deazaguanine reductase QueF-like protein